MFVYIPKNGRGEFAIVKIDELDYLRAVNQMFSELQKGEVSAREHSWISADGVEAELGLALEKA